MDGALRPRAAARSVKEDTSGEGALGEHRPLRTIDAPGTLDGGDVLCVGKELFVGIGPRTNADGIAQLRAILAPLGYTVNAVRYRGCLHLKSAATAIAIDRVLLNPAWVDASDFGGLRALDVDPSEPFAANALRVDETLVHAVESPLTRARLKAAGFAVRSVKAGELAKAEGGVTCCSLIVNVR
jgi:dimethylargininase